MSRHVWQSAEVFGSVMLCHVLAKATSDLLAGGCMWTHMMQAYFPNISEHSNIFQSFFWTFSTIPRRKAVNLLDLQPGLIVCDLNDPFTTSTPPMKKAPSQYVRICQNI